MANYNKIEQRQIHLLTIYENIKTGDASYLDNFFIESPPRSPSINTKLRIAAKYLEEENNIERENRKAVLVASFETVYE